MLLSCTPLDLVDLILAVGAILHVMTILWPEDERLKTSLHSHHFTDHLLPLLVFCYRNLTRLVDLTEDKVELDMTKVKTSTQHHR